jgi:hypothetical protein
LSVDCQVARADSSETSNIRQPGAELAEKRCDPAAAILKIGLLSSHQSGRDYLTWPAPS